MLENDIQFIYSHLQDEISKKIYADRLMYLLTGDELFVRNIVSSFDQGKAFLEKLFCNRECRMIFGAGTLGKDIVEAYGANWFHCFIDNNKSGQFCGLPVISFQEYLEDKRDALIIISSRLYYREIYQQLLDSGVADSDILCAGAVYDELSKAQYFDLCELKKEKIEDEVFVDCGCLDGMTSIQFAEWCDNKYKKIYAFEPDVNSYLKCVKILKDKFGDKVEIYQKGIWKEEDKLHFLSVGNGSSCLDEDGKEIINVTSIDKVIHDRVSFIKMDIEGVEYNALLGAKETIKKYKPKLAICIYHKPEDMWEIPMLILKINPEYKFYVRHYSVSKSETVLYAI